MSLVASILSSALLVSTPSPEKVLADVRAAYLGAGDIEAEFTQVNVDQLRGKKRKESGKLWAKKDGRVRWSYLDPVRKDFVYAPPGEASDPRLQSEMDDALRRLGADERECIILKVYTGLTFKEIAALRRVSINTAASWYRRGLEKMRAMLDGGESS